MRPPQLNVKASRVHVSHVAPRCARSRARTNSFSSHVTLGPDTAGGRGGGTVLGSLHSDLWMLKKLDVPSYTSIFNVNPKPHHSLEHFVNRYIANNRKRAQENMWSVLIYEGTLILTYWYCQCLCPLSSSCRSQNPVPKQQLPLTTILIITTLIQ